MIIIYRNFVLEIIDRDRLKPVIDLHRLIMLLKAMHEHVESLLIFHFPRDLIEFDRLNNLNDYSVQSSFF